MSRDPIGIHGGPNALLFVRNTTVGHIDYLGLMDDPGGGGSGTIPAPPEGKPADCGKCCTTSDGKTGHYRCKFVSTDGVVTGGQDEADSHKRWKDGGKIQDRDAPLRKADWNPTLCFDVPKCEDGWACQNDPPLFVDRDTGKHFEDGDGHPRGREEGTPDHDSDGADGVSSRRCFELMSRPKWLGKWSWKAYHSDKVLSAWCMKCVASDTCPSCGE